VSLVSFVMRVLGWGTVLFAVWFFGAAPLNAVVGWGASRWVEVLAPVEHVRASVQGRELAFQVEPDDATTRRIRLRANAVLDVGTNPLTHTYGIPFFLALLFASRPKGLASKAAVGCAVLLALASLSLGSDVMVRIGALPGPDGTAFFRFPGALREAISLLYQLGTLVFPTVFPVLLWGAMNRPLLDGLRRDNSIPA
jgi:hypothetical protein